VRDVLDFPLNDRTSAAELRARPLAGVGGVLNASDLIPKIGGGQEKIPAATADFKQAAAVSSSVPFD